MTVAIDINHLRTRALRNLLGHLDGSTTDLWPEVAGSAAPDFADPLRAELERDRIFGTVPFIAAHSSEIARKNDFVTVELPRNKVILIRQRDGGVKAMINSCRHRGAELVAEESGRCRLFSCPYHRWSYDPSGELRTVTLDDTFGDFDRSQYGLVQIPVEERHGFIWVVDDPNRSIDVAAWLGPEMDAIMASYDIGDLVSIDPHTYRRPTNWKIMQDGFLDNYHVKYAHPNTAGKMLHTNAVALEDFGRSFWFLTARKTLDQYIGQDVEWDESFEAHTIESCFLGPNTMLLKHATHFELLTFRPVGADPNQSIMQMRIMAPSVEASGLEPAHWEKRWAKNWGLLIAILHDEDFPILDGSQRSMNNLDAGPMLLGRNEIASHMFRRLIADLIGAPR
ncbi:aromatic ring-hydroxylating dioxygenase subunit alpha [Gordonia sp. HY002]|uniref:aromatic ring-hydroxylating oxygenase subunit alpha n=1 Tax=Gordonia zhenghanii TaxID=2911516 RepID=UPI001EF113F8|nr:aromatic ring-hydroxylating dioxygenase subunit alpha [Gordonia zhenghanii]MCF8571323.1 aromatic ring-hydroxylating dioxygenase subunit alpha [Gordonia zhenghanii]MCF8601847.1 aromatic ring-hydroxylating dioxygenase subunit alpha [Gordonia zhenghanii]